MTEPDEFIQLQWRNDWGTDYLAHASWDGSADQRKQQATLSETVTFVTGDGHTETGRIVMQPRSKVVADHGCSTVAKFEVPMIVWSVLGTETTIDPTAVQISRSSFVSLPVQEHTTRGRSIELRVTGTVSIDVEDATEDTTGTAEEVAALVQQAEDRLRATVDGCELMGVEVEGLAVDIRLETA